MGFGNIELSNELLSILVISTVCALAAMYIGFRILATVFGAVSVIIGAKVVFYGKSITLFGFTVGSISAFFLIVFGIALIYMGTKSFLSGETQY